MTSDRSAPNDAQAASPAPQLLVAAWTSAGNAPPLTADERSPFDFRDRVVAAAAAGFGGFGLLHADLVGAVERYGLAGMKAIFDDNGIEHVELEMLGDWFAAGEARAVSDSVRRDLLTASEVLQPRQLKVGADYTGRPWPDDKMAEEFATLCAQAADAGTRIALEPMPFANVKDVHDGRALVERAGHPSGGLLVDIWHVCRAGTPFADVAALPAGMIFAVELDDADAAVVGTLLEDTLHERRLCGDGSFDIYGLIDAVRKAGFSGPWGVEIISREHRARSLHEQVTRAFETTLAYLC